MPLKIKSSREFQSQDTTIALENGVCFDSEHTVLMAGPCAVESESQVLRSAEFLRGIGVNVFRAGAFKPRTNPYAFQGAEYDGLRWLERVRNDFNMTIITEARDASHIKEVADVADIIQIGSKSMFNHALLKYCGTLDKPVMLKRFFSATVDEFMKMADFVLLQGNSKLILCERGIRTFEPSTRFSLDLSGAAVIAEKSHLPLVLDPSHAVGHAFAVPRLAKACAAFGCNGLLIEVHPDVDNALCDKEQALDHKTFKPLKEKLEEICLSVGRKLI